MGQGIRLGRVFGIDIHLDWSLLIIFLLIVVSLGAGTVPALHPQWSAVTVWGTALVAAVLFFASVLTHELCHALVGRLHDIRVPRITLFIFGGLAQMENEPAHWRDELWMALAGPAASLVLGVIFITLGNLVMGPETFDPGQPRESLERLSPLATLLMWLGPINIVLGLFNLVPGFPLDGGRVLRAVMWGASGNRRRATRWASRGGQAFAWLLIATGVAMVLGAQVPLFGRGPVNGLWLVLIGWFLNSAALSSYQQMLVGQALRGVSVRGLMRSDLVTVSPRLTLNELGEAYLGPGGQRAFPVVEGKRLVGLVTLTDVRAVDRAVWGESPVREIMVPANELVTVSPDDDAFKALTTLTRSGVDQLPVAGDGQYQGTVRRRDILNWLSVYGDPQVARQLEED
ncbi:site-2 protease family protein [Thiohalorhabdus sp.]|uniref:site-2 protease family protein n=1 Tax=Thiohalorhabdus sp. TaxID=3094134 RepID=UPI002FC36AFD